MYATYNVICASYNLEWETYQLIKLDMYDMTVMSKENQVLVVTAHCDKGRQTTTGH